MYKLTKARIAPLAAEFLGTSILVMVALVLSETTGVSYFIGTSVAIALGLVYMLFGQISGGHFNPAITFGLWTARRVGTIRGVAYIVAQLLGGIASWQLYQYFTNHTLVAKHVSYSTSVLVAELVGTAILALGFSTAMARGLGMLESALTYGASLFVGIMVAATASAGYLNPAVAAGVHSWNWVYVVGPLAGGLIGVNLFTYLFATNKK